MPDTEDLAALTVAELVEQVRELRAANAQLRRQLHPVGPPLAAHALAGELIRQTALLARLGIEFRDDLEPMGLIQQTLQAVTVDLPADEATVVLIGPDRQPSQALTVALGAPRLLPPERAAELIGQGSAGWALRQGSSIVLLDLANDVRRFQLRELQTGGSLIATPIRQPTATTGVLIVYRLATNAFSSNELILIESIATQLSVALGAVQLSQQYRLRQHRFLNLLNLGQLATAGHTVGDVAARCYTIAIETFAARWGLLFLYPAPQAPLAWIEPANLAVDVPITAIGGAAQLAAESQHVVTVALGDDVTCLALPLTHDGTTIGGLALGFTGQRPSPGGLDWNLLELFASQTATVCATLQLVQRLHEQAQLLEELVTERTDQLQRSRDVLRMVFDSLPEGVVLLDESERLAAVNTVFANQIVGRHPRDLVGKTYAHLLRMIERAAPTTIELVPEARSGRQQLRLRQRLADGERSFLIERMGIPSSQGQPASRLEFWRRES
ncbi:GAF domain-containing protein [Chloroflexus aggregans]|uniref:GAF sensor protein n=1 Tax=Chloroflexus aggregans (strain MD-66 / DSM 9485) TaxID=326427 RepID=B8GC08_CHLAD|nr:GAF domain-containing protein [Chloroflexus aggregans]ACL22982.1 putative GAF sensor protein [Chloroflexus aggregans DSM 9485]